MSQPVMFEVVRKENFLFILRNKLYGLKQPPWHWYKQTPS